MRDFENQEQQDGDEDETDQAVLRCVSDGRAWTGRFP